jgi:hypothetical protein
VKVVAADQDGGSPACTPPARRMLLPDQVCPALSSRTRAWYGSHFDQSSVPTAMTSAATTAVRVCADGPSVSVAG